MKRIILIGMIGLFSKLSFGQKGNHPLISFAFDSVIFYDFGGLPEDDIVSIMQNDGKLSWSVKKSVRLDAKTADFFTQLILEPGSYSDTIAACFEPHLGIVYYYLNKPTVYVNICMECNKMASNVTFKAQLAPKAGNKNGDYYVLEGLSKQFRKEINTLLVKYNFSHQVTTLTSFDK